MSKIGQSPVAVPQSVSVKIQDKTISIQGKEGLISLELPTGITVENKGATLEIKRSSNEKKQKSLHGLYRSLISNAVVGVEKPWEKRLEVVGTGYNVKMQGADLAFKVGYNHLVMFKKVDRASYQVEGTNKVIIKSVDKQLAGELAYKIKMIKKPDAYKGKGIKYEGEKLRIKPGKKAKTGTA